MEQPSTKTAGIRKPISRPGGRPIWRQMVVLAFLLGSIGYGLSGCGGSPENSATNSEEVAILETPDDLPANLSNAIKSRSDEDDGGAFAKFTHTSDYHARLPCLVCHKRENNSARISFPGRVDHSPCAGCHTLQFANENSSICTVCHTDAEAGRLKAFPPLRSFGARFDHAKHRKTNCGTCHKPAGAALSIPNRGNAHNTCFQCHSSRASQSMASCGLCHEKGAGRMRASTGSKAFSANFSHAKHGPRQNLNCSNCHTVYSRSSRGKQVTAPVTAMHFAKKGVTSCSSCHNNERAFGGDDFADCKRCHQGNSFRF